MIGARKLQLEQFPGYKPFGYRSQDKGFHVDQATIHIFQIFPSIVQKIDISSCTKIQKNRDLLKNFDLKAGT